MTHLLGAFVSSTATLQPIFFDHFAAWQGPESDSGSAESNDDGSKTEPSIIGNHNDTLAPEGEAPKEDPKALDDFELGWSDCDDGSTDETSIAQSTFTFELDLDSIEGPSAFTFHSDAEKEAETNEDSMSCQSLPNHNTTASAADSTLLSSNPTEASPNNNPFGSRAMETKLLWEDMLSANESVENGKIVVESEETDVVMNSDNLLTDEIRSKNSDDTPNSNNSLNVHSDDLNLNGFEFETPPHNSAPQSNPVASTGNLDVPTLDVNGNPDVTNSFLSLEIPETSQNFVTTTPKRDSHYATGEPIVPNLWSHDPWHCADPNHPKYPYMSVAFAREGLETRANRVNIHHTAFYKETDPALRLLLLGNLAVANRDFLDFFDKV